MVGTEITATTVPVVVIDEKLQRLLAVTESTLELAITMLTNGRRLGDFGSRRGRRSRGQRIYSGPDFVGHGVGVNSTKNRRCRNYGRRGSGPKMKPGMTLAIEPIGEIWGKRCARFRRQMDGGDARWKTSAHFEHTVLITKGEPEILTWRKRTLLK